MSGLSKLCVKWDFAHFLSIHDECQWFVIVGGMLLTIALTVPTPCAHISDRLLDGAGQKWRA